MLNLTNATGNAVWEDAESACRALRGLTSQPVVLRSKFIEEVADSADQPMETVIPSASSTDDTTPTSPSQEVRVQWHLGVGYPKAKQLLLRNAVEGDEKISGAAQRSRYYRKYGNPNKRIAAVSGVTDTWREKHSSKDLR